MFVFISSSPNSLGRFTFAFFPWPLITAFPGCLAVSANISANILAHLKDCFGKLINV